MNIFQCGVCGAYRIQVGDRERECPRWDSPLAHPERFLGRLVQVTLRRGWNAATIRFRIGEPPLLTLTPDTASNPFSGPGCRAVVLACRLLD